MERDPAEVTAVLAFAVALAGCGLLADPVAEVEACEAVAQDRLASVPGHERTNYERVDHISRPLDDRWQVIIEFRTSPHDRRSDYQVCEFALTNGRADTGRPLAFDPEP